MDSGTSDGEKQGLELSDIMSMLDDGKQKKPKKAAEAKKTNEQVPAPQESSSTAVGRDNAFISKLLSDIEQKNAEILKLNSDNMTLKYEIKEKELEIKKLASDLEEAKKSLDDAAKKLEEANAKLGEMDADRAKLKLNTKGPSDGEEAEEAQPEEDVASIFKRLTKGDERPPEDDPLNVNPDKPRPPRKTAKLYDL
jgi:septal ring factor EnvC (AmiA/AmiB activator)